MSCNRLQFIKNSASIWSREVSCNLRSVHFGVFRECSGVLFVLARGTASAPPPGKVEVFVNDKPVYADPGMTVLQVGWLVQILLLWTGGTLSIFYIIIYQKPNSFLNLSAFLFLCLGNAWSLFHLSVTALKWIGSAGLCIYTGVQLQSCCWLGRTKI